MNSSTTTVRVSPKYQIVIPSGIREEAEIRPGTQLKVVLSEGSLKLIPIRPLAELRGRVKRDDSIVLRDKGERF